MSQKLYDNYYFNQKDKQNRVISRDNYTYETLISFIDRFDIRNRRIIDLGCGVGTIDFYLASKGNLVTGLDISLKAIKKARKSAKALNYENVCNFKQVDLNKDFNLSSKFDVIICSEVLEHIENDMELVNKIKFIAEKGGLVIFSVPLKNAPLFRWGLLRKFDDRVGHLRRYDEVMLFNLFNKLHYTLLAAIETEGVFRNLLFTSGAFGIFLRLAKGPVINIYHFIDRLSIFLFGPSNKYYIFRA